MLALDLRLVLRRLAVDLPHKVIEDLVHIDLGLGRGLEEGAGEGLSKVQPLVLANNTFVLEITLVAH